MDNPEKLATQGTHDEEKQNKTKHNTICVSYVKDGINSYFYSSLIDVLRHLIRKCQLRGLLLIFIRYNEFVFAIYIFIVYKFATVEFLAIT